MLEAAQKQDQVRATERQQREAELERDVNAGSTASFAELGDSILNCEGEPAVVISVGAQKALLDARLEEDTRRNAAEIAAEEARHAARQAERDAAAEVERARLEALQAAAAKNRATAAARRMHAAVLLQAVWRGLKGRRKAAAMKAAAAEAAEKLRRVEERAAAMAARRQAQLEAEQREWEIKEKARREAEAAAELARQEAEEQAKREALEEARREKAARAAAEAAKRQAAAEAAEKARCQAEEEARLKAQKKAELDRAAAKAAARAKAEAEQARLAAAAAAAEAQRQAELELALLEEQAAEMAAVTLQQAWRAYRQRTVEREARYTAAVIIQSMWRGYWVRKRLGILRQHAQFVDSDDDFEYDEVDLAEFELSDDGDDPFGCIDSASTTLASSNLENMPEVVQVPAHGSSASPELPPQIQEAWAAQPVSNVVLTEPKSPEERAAERETKAQAEWGFKNPQTAAAMLRRAKKLGPRKKAKGRSQIGPRRVRATPVHNQESPHKQELIEPPQPSFAWASEAPLIHDELRLGGTPPLPPIPRSPAPPAGRPPRRKGGLIRERQLLLPQIAPGASRK